LKKLEAKQKKKEEKDILLKTLEKKAEEKKLNKEKINQDEVGEIQHNDMSVFIKSDKEENFVDEDIIKVLLITDDLLGNLPQDVIDKFTQSEDFKLYEKVISKYKK